MADRQPPPEPLRVSILTQGPYLIASIHTALDDGQLMRFQHDLRQWEIAAAIGCSHIQVSRIISTSLERLSAHASMACGG